MADNRTKRYIDLFINGSAVQNDIKSVSSAMRKLVNEQSRMTIGSKEYIQKASEIKKLKGILAQHRSDISQTQRSWLNLSKAADGFNKYFGMLTAGAASIMGIAYSTQQWIQGNVGLSDSLANVMKTTGLTREEVRGLYGDFKYLNTRTPRAELLKLAEEAGRLGKKGKKDIMEFVEVANKISVALGDDLGGNAEEAVREVGKITDNLKVGAKYGVDFGEAMNKVGSAINEVSANSKAQAGYIIEYTKRTQGLGEQANISADQLIGLAATFDESGQAVEMSATAVNKIIVDMYRDASEYAKVAKMSTQEFTDLLNKDANAAFIKMLEGLKGNNAGLGIMVQKFDAMGIDGARATQALASLVGNLDRLKINQETANIAMKEGTSLINEYNVKNENLAANVDKLSRFIHGKFINSSFLGWMEKVVGKMADWAEIKLEDKLKDERLEINRLVIKLTSANIAEDERRKIYEQLKELQPDIVDGISLENIETGKLIGNLRTYNELQIKKIAIAKYGEELQDLNKAAGDAGAELLAAEDKLASSLEVVTRLIKEQNSELGTQAEEILLSNLSMEEKSQKLIDLQKNQGLFIAASNNRMQNAAVLLGQAKEKEAKATEAATVALDKYAEAQKRILGNSEAGAGGNGGSGNNGGSGSGSSNTPSVITEEFSKIEEEYLRLIDTAPARLKAKLQKIVDTIKEFKTPVNDAMNDNSFQNEEETVAPTSGEYIADEALKSSFDLRREILKAGYEGERILKEEYDAQLAELDKEENAAFKLKLADKLNKLVGYLQAAQQALTVLNDFQQQKDNEEMRRFEADDAAKRESLDRQLKEGTINRKQYNNAIAKMDQDLDNKKKELQYKADMRQWESALLAAIISTAQATAEALTAGPGVGIALSVITAALGGVQTGIIAANPPKKYALGGFTTGDKIYRAGEEGREYIAPNWQLQDPTLGPIINDLDRIRTGKNPNYLFNSTATAYPSSRATDVAGRIGAGQSYMSTSTNNNYYGGNKAGDFSQMTASILRLERYLSDPRNRQATINNDLRTLHDDEMGKFNALSKME